MAQGPFFLSTPRASSIRITLRFRRTSRPQFRRIWRRLPIVPASEDRLIAHHYRI